MPKLFLLAGTTASGKTEFALRFAQQHHCEILSCDASAFYRGMDIGTAKPTREEQRIVRHWGIDICEPNEYFSIKDFVRYAQRCVEEITQRGKNVLVVGGSGFYLKSFLEQVVDDVLPNAKIQQEIADLEAVGGKEACLERLKTLDPSVPADWSLRKIKKALERCMITGLSVQESLRRFQQQAVPYPSLPKIVLYLCVPLEVIQLRIRLRTHSMLQKGLIEEVQLLQKQGKLLPNRPASLAIGYRETLAFLQHQLPFEALEPSIVKNTDALVKKQKTWFRHQIAFDRYIYA